MGHNDLCRERCNSAGSQASLWGLSSWTNASLVALAFWEQRSKQRPPKENTQHPGRLPQRNGGARRHFSQPRELLLKKHKGLLRGRHRKHFLRRNLQLVWVMEPGNRNRALGLHHYLKTTLKSRSSTGMFRGRCASGIGGVKRILPCSLSIGTDAWVLFVIRRPVVKQVQEKVFTSDAFQELDLHPHLVSISQCLVRSVFSVWLFLGNVCEMTVLGRKIKEWLFLFQFTWMKSDR